MKRVNTLLQGTVMFVALFVVLGTPLQLNGETTARMNIQTKAIACCASRQSTNQ